MKLAEWSGVKRQRDQVTPERFSVESPRRRRGTGSSFPLCFTARPFRRSSSSNTEFADDGSFGPTASYAPGAPLGHGILADDRTRTRSSMKAANRVTRRSVLFGAAGFALAAGSEPVVDIHQHTNYSGRT